MRLAPFRALLPPPELAARVASVPYDVVDRREASDLAAGNPLSFLRVVRSEIDFPGDVDPYGARVYAKAADNFAALRRDGALRQDAAAGLYVYRLTMGGRAQSGVVGCVHVDDYAADAIRKHEKTRPDKEDDRTRHMLALDAHAEPVLLAYRDRADIAALVAGAIATAPLFDFTAPDGVRHELWRAPQAAALVAAFAGVPRCYIADGHHRCASAARAAAQRRGCGAAQVFPAALFPAAQLHILPYHRLVRDLAGMSPAALLQRLATLGRLEAAADPDPGGPGRFALFLGEGWHRLALSPEAIDGADPVRGLDAHLLQERVLAPILGIGDPRTDRRLDFVGGGRGTSELEQRVRDGRAALAIALHPPSMAQLLAVADAGGIMPPKSTWFEPKLRSGLFVHAWQ